MSRWRPIRTAPKDGTVILVAESPNGEAVNVMTARWHTHYSGPPTDQPEQNPDWWGASFRTGWNGWVGLYGHADDVAISPTHWMPLPKPPTAQTSGK